MPSGSVSGVAGCSVLVGCDVVQEASKGLIASIFDVKQPCWPVLNLCYKLSLSR